jgi:hypothetical protein
MRLSVKYAEIERQHREDEEVESHPQPDCVYHVLNQKGFQFRLAPRRSVAPGRRGRLEMALCATLAFSMTVVDAGLEFGDQLSQ